MTHSTALTLARDALTHAFDYVDEAARKGYDGTQGAAIRERARHHLVLARKAIAAIDAELAASADAGRLPQLPPGYMIVHKDDRSPVRLQDMPDFAAPARAAPADGLTTLTVATHHPQDYTLHNAANGTTWRGTADGQWVAEPAPVKDSLTIAPVSAQGDEVDAARYRFLRDSPRAEWRPYALRAACHPDACNAAVDAARARQGASS